MTQRKALHRLAIRAEGNHTMCAYFAEQGTMANAKLIGTMSRELADACPDAFEAFKLAMSISLIYLIKVFEGATEVGCLEEHPAPPSERGGGRRGG